jgi:hypothetical protein
MRYILLLLISMIATTAAAETWAEINAREAIKEQENLKKLSTHLICGATTTHGDKVWQVMFFEPDNAFYIKASADRGESGWNKIKKVEFDRDLILMGQTSLGKTPLGDGSWNGVLDRVSGIFSYDATYANYSLDCVVYEEMERKF